MVLQKSAEKERKPLLNKASNPLADAVHLDNPA
jgi:hypothetical protein